MAALTNEQLQVIIDLNLDDDLRQDLVLAWLESEEPPYKFTSVHHIRAFVAGYYRNLKRARYQKEYNRLRLLLENEEDVRDMCMSADGEDPMDILIAEEEMRERYEGLSPLLKTTLDATVHEGMIPEEIAEAHGVSADVIYKRIERIKLSLKGNNNE